MVFSLLTGAGTTYLDTFDVKGPSGTTPPSLSGDNTGQHSKFLTTSKHFVFMETVYSPLSIPTENDQLLPK